MYVQLIILAVLSSFLVESMAWPAEFAESAHNRHARALGMKKKTPKPNKYPWDPTQNKNVQLSYTDTMKKHMKPEEEPFRDDYYEDYDFEFPKGMIRNDNHEVKKLRDMRRRLEG